MRLAHASRRRAAAQRALMQPAACCPRRLACGDVGVGAMAEVAALAEAVRAALAAMPPLPREVEEDAARAGAELDAEVAA